MGLSLVRKGGKFLVKGDKETVKASKASLRGQGGFTFALVLAVLAVGTLMIIPTLHLASTGSLASAFARSALLEEYAADAGVEHAMWRMARDDAFLDAFTWENPVQEYTVTTNGIDATVTVTLGWPEPPLFWTSSRIEVTMDYWPKPIEDVEGGEEVTFAITLRNIGGSRVMTEQVGFLMGLYPGPAFAYIPESVVITGTGWRFDQVGLDFQTVVVGDWQYIEMAYDTPRPRLDPGEWVTFTFLTLAPDFGTFYVQGWAIEQPDSIDLVAAPGVLLSLGGGVRFIIESQTPGADVRAWVRMDGERRPGILSWQIG